MQGRNDEPLNETGIAQAREARAAIDVMVFDAVYSSPLDRAITTASIIGGVPRDQVIIDERIIETDFGKYNLKPYAGMGLKMTLYWVFPEVFPAPESVETIESMVSRSRSFIEDLCKEGREKGYENVLVACHGGIIRALCGVLEDAPRGIKWRPKPKNCEIRTYEIK